MNIINDDSLKSMFNLRMTEPSKIFLNYNRSKGFTFDEKFKNIFKYVENSNLDNELKQAFKEIENFYDINKDVINEILENKNGKEKLS